MVRVQTQVHQLELVALFCLHERGGHVPALRCPIALIAISRPGQCTLIATCCSTASKHEGSPFSTPSTPKVLTHLFFTLLNLKPQLLSLSVYFFGARRASLCRNLKFPRLVEPLWKGPREWSLPIIHDRTNFRNTCQSTYQDQSRS